MEVGVTITLGVITAVVVGLVQVAKNMGLPSKYAPLFAILFGVIGTVGMAFPNIAFDTIVYGFVIGLTACGLYSGTKATVGK